MEVTAKLNTTVCWKGQITRIILIPLSHDKDCSTIALYKSLAVTWVFTKMIMLVCFSGGNCKQEPAFSLAVPWILKLCLLFAPLEAVLLLCFCFIIETASFNMEGLPAKYSKLKEVVFYTVKTFQPYVPNISYVRLWLSN